MFKTLCFSSLLALLAVAQGQSNPKSDQEDISREIIAMERAALDRSDKGDPGMFLDISDPAVVYIDPYLEKPIYGLDALRAYYAKAFAPVDGKGEMLNPNVQRHGDIAVLTFNYDSTIRPSTSVTHWSTTEVYRRTAQGWRIIHTHWALRQPVPQGQ